MHFRKPNDKTWTAKMPTAISEILLGKEKKSSFMNWPLGGKLNLFVLLVAQCASANNRSESNQTKIGKQ